MAKWASVVHKTKDGDKIRVQVPLDGEAKLNAGPDHESVKLGLWDPKTDKGYQAALKKKSDIASKVEAGKIARGMQEIKW